MKIIIVGGHLAPALAVIERLPKDTEILFVGRKYALEGDKAFSLEYQKITSLRIPFKNLTTGRLQRKITRYTLFSLLKLPIGFIQSFKILANFKPDVVVCFGGYVQIPVVLAAYTLRIPVITHEQTRKAGLANKLISPLANTICISWPESAAYFPKTKTVLTGLPLRKEFFQNPPPPSLIREGASSSPDKGRLGGVFSRENRTIYITGGSLGAHALNVLIESIITKLLEKFYVVHQTGDSKEYNDYERLHKIKKGLPKNLQDKYILSKFIDPDQAVDIMKSADLIISRSGINTVAELMYLEKPCLLIPLPHGQRSEQLDNALSLQKLGLAQVIKQEELTPEILYSQITRFIAKLDSKGKKTSSTRKLIKYDAAEKIVQLIIQAYRQKNTEKN